MAFIYRYQLRDVNLRNNISLAKYKQEILTVIEKHFGKNLKDSIVEDKYFEFKLYATVQRGLLQEMGRMLKASVPIDAFRNGFVRMEQTLYAFVYLHRIDSLDDTQKEMIHIELIDSTLLDNKESFMQRANNFYKKSRNRGLLFEKDHFDNSEGVIKNFYIDILDAYVDEHWYPECTNNTPEIRCFYVKGFHRHINNRDAFNEDQSFYNLLQIESCFDIGFIENQEANSDIEGARKSHIDYLKIHSVEKKPELLDRIKNELKLNISPTENIEALNSISKNLTGDANRCVFKTHNVGQALASSLAYEDSPPFLYFDYGMPFGGNSFTRPTSVNMPTNPGITIILSHTHKDHWFRLADDINAYQCLWYIPEQPREAQLNHKLAEIIVKGGSVHTITSDLLFPCIKLTHGVQSKIDPSRKAKHVHETGFAFRIQAKDDHGKGLNILVAGDQRYDYVEESQLSNLDILVASHHGGSFCWSMKGVIPAARRPMSSKVVYSYGLNNTYDHPSKLADYKVAYWLIEHHTCRDGDFKADIYF